ncbi:MAG: RIP metalloprotease RseP [Acidobacteria bacterium]|nr:RIP metalloprotease RseP [Acidobacteriota bacterium]
MDRIEQVFGMALSFLVVLTIVVVIHELGHFITAKLLKIRAEVFSMGFGKRIFGFKWGDTDYRLSAIPLGGYVRLSGEQNEDAKGQPDEFLSHPRWQRIFVYAMGPVMNVILAVGLFSIAYMIGVEEPAYREQPPLIGYVEKDSPAQKAGMRIGDLVVEIEGRKVATWNDVEMAISTSPDKEMGIAVEREHTRVPVSIVTTSKTRYSIGYAGFTPRFPTRIQSVSNGMPADRAGLQKGDVIVSIDSRPVTTFQEVSALIRAHPGIEMAFGIRRGADLLEKRITPKNEKGIGVIGISPAQDTVMRSYPFPRAIGEGGKQCWELSTLVFQVLRKYFQREMPISNLSGPLDIAAISYSIARTGLSEFLSFLAAISLQLGIINLLPIPVLDGGHIFLLGIESAARRDLSLRIKERILQFGFALIILLMGFVLINDIVKFLPESLYKYVPWHN